MTQTSDGSWLQPVFDAANAGMDVLVLCRATSSVRLVLRALASGGPAGKRGYAGLQVTTLSGYVHAALPGALVETPHEGIELPSEHPWAPLLTDRPRLTAQLRQHAERVQLTAIAGAPLVGLRRELQVFTDSAWGRTALAEAAPALLRSRAPGPVFAVGFPEPPATGFGTVGPFERAVLAALHATHLSAAPCREEGPLAARRLPDVGAEARAIAASVLASEAPADRVLVLVPDIATEERVRCALRRNGIPVGDDGASPLSRHALVALLAPLLPLFASGGGERVHAQDLLRLLVAPVLARTPPRAGIVPVPGIDAQRASVRQIRRVIAGCGRVSATLADWLGALAQLEARAEHDHQATKAEDRAGPAARLVAARIVRARVETVARHAAGAGTLGDLAGLVVDLKLSDPADRHGHAIIGALRDNRRLPAEQEAFEEALGSAISSGRVDLGVQILRYHAYDGRDSDLLLLAGVHDKGLGASPRPDPFLTAADGRLLGLPSPRETVLERIALAISAARRCLREPVAYVTTHDATGRAAGTPVDLPLCLDDRDRLHSHGLTFDLPERRDRAALIEGEGVRDQATLQVDAEWVREGSAETAYTCEPFEATEDPLPDYLDAHEVRLPERLRPYLGEAGVYPDANNGLPTGFRLSASRATAFSQCLWRAYAQSALALESPEVIEEDLDATEVGSAMHRALQDAVVGVRWIVPTASVAAAREALLTRLVAATAKALDEQADERPAAVESAAMRSARRGLAQRWGRHWGHYVRVRIIGFDEAQEALLTSVFQGIEQEPEFVAALDALGPGLSPAQRRFLATGLRDGLIDAAGDGTRLQTDVVVGRLGVRTAPAVRARLDLARPAELDLLLDLTRSLAAEVEYRPSGDLEVVGLEVGFGKSRGAGEAVWLQLGPSRVEVRGSIDVVDRRHGSTPLAASMYRVGDFKTGGLAGQTNQIVASLVRPQLSFYALVLRHQGPLHDHPAPVVTEELYYDQVRSLDRVAVGIDDETLDHVATTFGRILGRAEKGFWPLLPHPDGCPIRGAKGAYCDFSEICRLRGSFAPEEEHR